MSDIASQDSAHAAPFEFSFLQTLREAYGTPLFVYDRNRLESAAREVLAFPHAYGLTARYAVKANPTAAIIRLFSDMGLHFDASSGFEVRRLLHAGVPGERISLSTQELPGDFKELLQAGISINACSLSQLARIGEAAPGTAIGVRFNPGAGSGGTRKTNTGGPESSFGIWHEHLPVVKRLTEIHDLRVFRIHTHIGSGSDPEKWVEISRSSLELARAFPSVETVNLGGGYKVARVPGEVTTDLQVVGAAMETVFRDFARETGRQLRLEVEPGTFLVARAGFLLSMVQDVVDTGSVGFRFLKLDSGMTDILRPSLYGAQHPMWLSQAEPSTAQAEYVVVGHCCESGDLLSPAPGEPEVLSTRAFPEALIGDLLLIGGAGAYCATMATLNYNSFPAAAEVMVGDGEHRLIRRRQTLEQIWENEVGEDAPGAEA